VPANAARNLTALSANTELFGTVGHDDAARQLKELLAEQHVGCTGLIPHPARATSLKTAHRRPQATGRAH